MIQEYEVVMLLLGVVGLIFVLRNRLDLKRLPESSILLSGFYVILAGWVLTILENFFWAEFLNILEHIFYASSSVLIAIWCWKIFGKVEGRQ